MAERLSRQTHRELARSIWKVAEVGMPTLLGRIRQPSTAEKQFQFGSRLLDIALDLVPHDITQQPLPVWAEAKITEIEPHAEYHDYDFYTYKTLTLGLEDYSKLYETGSYEGSDRGSETITPITEGPYARAGGLVSPTKFARAVGGVGSHFGKAEVEYFLTNLATFAERLKQDL